MNTYDRAISEYAEKKFADSKVIVLKNSLVDKIDGDLVHFNDLKAPEDSRKVSLPYGVCVWATGIGLNPLILSILETLGDKQQNRRAIETDSQLRVIGAPPGEVYAIGDCSTVRNDLAEHLSDFVRQAHPQSISVDNIPEDQLMIDYPTFQTIIAKVKKAYPQADEMMIKMKTKFDRHAIEKSNQVSVAQIREMFRHVDHKMTSLPALAQRANQQGKYLGRKFTKMHQKDTEISILPANERDEAAYSAFKYKHAGSLAYLGTSAAIDFSNGRTFTGGLIAMYAWRGVYFSEQISNRSRILLFIDWLKRGIWGRDSSWF